MNVAFESSQFDPFRMLAEMFASVAYAKGDPFAAIQPLAFSSGDSDTVCALLGSIMGIWYGARQLRQHKDLSDDLDVVTAVLTETFKVDLDQHVALFLELQNRQQELA